MADSIPSLDGPIGEYGVDFVSFWEDMVLENDFVNANTGLYDPRHLFGTMSQDVLRWPALVLGTERQLLAQFITFLMMPGAPQLLWGEEQRFSTLDSTSADYLYGREPMSSNRAWQIHGCYAAGYETYVNLPLGPALYGCLDETNGLDRSKSDLHSAESPTPRVATGICFSTFFLLTHGPQRIPLTQSETL